MTFLDYARHPAPLRIAVQAERTRISPTGSKTWEEEVYLWLDRLPTGQAIVRMDGGPTGRESFVLTRANVTALRERCWVACQGGNGWDRMVIPSREMQTFFASVGLTASAEAA